MSVIYGIQINFTTWTDYRQWLREWKASYKSLSDRCKSLKGWIKRAQQTKDYRSEQRYMNEYRYAKIFINKLILLLEKAKERWKYIKKLNREYKSYLKSLPLRIENIDSATLYFCEEAKDILWLPKWELKINDKKYLISNFENNAKCKSEDLKLIFEKINIKIDTNNKLYIDNT